MTLIYYSMGISRTSKAEKSDIKMRGKGFGSLWNFIEFVGITDNNEKMLKGRPMEQDWAVVLAGGGAKGAYQIGALKALQEMGYFEKIKAWSGDSIGAINLCLMTGSSVEQAWKAWRELNVLQIFDFDESLIDGREGLFSRNTLVNLMDQYIDYERVSKSEAYVNATRMNYARDNTLSMPEAISVDVYRKENAMTPVYFSLSGKTKEQIQQIVLASSALPVIYEDVEIDGAYYRDGGLTDNLPAKPLRERGYEKLILILLDHETEYEAKENEMVIRPSRSLGDLIDGTLNFTSRKIHFLLEFGYYDTLAQIKKYQEIQALEDVRIEQKKDSVQTELEELKRQLGIEANEIKSELEITNSDATNSDITNIEATYPESINAEATYLEATNLESINPELTTPEESMVDQLGRIEREIVNQKRIEELEDAIRRERRRLESIGVKNQAYEQALFEVKKAELEQQVQEKISYLNNGYEE